MIQEKMKTSESDSRITKVVKRSFESDLYRVSQKKLYIVLEGRSTLKF